MFGTNSRVLCFRFSPVRRPLPRANSGNVPHRPWRPAASAILLFLLTPQLFAQEQGDAELARMWLRRAVDLVRTEGNEDWDAVVHAVQTALEFQTAGADSLYLQARLALAGRPLEEEDASPLRTAHRLAGEALDEPPGPDLLVSFSERAEFWASLSLRLKAYRPYLQRYESWGRGNRDNPVLLYAAARSALYLGLEAQASDLAVRGEAMADADTDLRILNPEFPEAAPGFRAIAVAAGNASAIAGLPAAHRRWGGGLEAALEPWLLSGVMRRTDILDGLINPETVQFVEALAGNLPPGAIPLEHSDDLALLHRMRALLPAEGMTGGYTGILTADANYDGHPEEWLRLINGRPDFRKKDADQDGVYEWEITYRGEWPLQIRLFNGDLTVNYEDSAYPEVYSILRRSGQITVEAFFHPGGFAWNPTGGDALMGHFTPPRWSDGELWPGMRMVRVQVDDEEGRSEVVTHLASGYPVRAQERRFDGEASPAPTWIREILYEEGVPIAGRRSYSHDAHRPERRLWELYERYEQGEMVGMAWDPGMRGRPFYLSDWGLEGYLETQAWDWDGDDWLDLRRLRLPNGGEDVRELRLFEVQTEDLLPWSAGEWFPWE